MHKFARESFDSATPQNMPRDYRAPALNNRPRSELSSIVRGSNSMACAALLILICARALLEKRACASCIAAQSDRKSKTLRTQQSGPHDFECFSLG
jgi:hypothetical protein